jgi:hypothetical protein
MIFLRWRQRIDKLCIGSVPEQLTTDCYDKTMTGSRCTLCKRNVDRAAMSRCRDNRCPSRPRNARASSSVLVGGGIGLLILGSIVMGTWLLAAPGKSAGASDTGAATPENRAEASRQAINGAGTNVVKWLDTLVSAPKAPPAERAADVQDSSVPDPRAGSRVMNFSCSGAMPASRSRICTDWTLATVDYNLSLFYRSALARAKNPEALRRANAVWLARLDKLGNDTDELIQFYSDWRADLARF